MSDVHMVCTACVAPRQERSKQACVDCALWCMQYGERTWMGARCVGRGGGMNAAAGGGAHSAPDAKIGPKCKTVKVIA